MKPTQKLVNKDGIEVILWPQTQLNLTQGCGDDLGYTWLSHEGTWALDNVDTSDIKLYAPVTLKCIGKYHLGNGNEVVWQSVNKVLFADGSIDYLILDIWHDKNVSDISIGKEVLQGNVFQQMGCSGIGSGCHTHIEAGKGIIKIGSSSPLIYSKGWTHFDINNFHPGTLPNSIDPRLVYFVNSTEILNDYGMKFKTYISDGWKTAENGQWHYIKNGSIVKNDMIWDKENQAWYAFDKDGYMIRSSLYSYQGKFVWLEESGKMLVNSELMLIANNSGYLHI